MGNNDNGGLKRFDPKHTHFSWGLAESQEARNTKPTPDKVLAPFITPEVISNSIDSILNGED